MWEWKTIKWHSKLDSEPEDSKAATLCFLLSIVLHSQNWAFCCIVDKGSARSSPDRSPNLTTRLSIQTLWPGPIRTFQSQWFYPRKTLYVKHASSTPDPFHQLLHLDGAFISFLVSIFNFPHFPPQFGLELIPIANPPPISTATSLGRWRRSCDPSELCIFISLPYLPSSTHTSSQTLLWLTGDRERMTNFAHHWLPATNAIIDLNSRPLDACLRALWIINLWIFPNILLEIPS